MYDKVDLEDDDESIFLVSMRYSKLDNSDYDAFSGNYAFDLRWPFWKRGTEQTVILCN